jgi:predicted MFS family arabinose efflux permease
MFSTFGVMFLVKVHKLPVTTMGILMTGFGVGILFGGLLFGFLADRIGRRTVGIITLTVGGIFGLVFASLQPGTSLIVIAAVILLYCGTSGGQAAHSQLWVLKVSALFWPPQRRASSMALVNLSEGGSFPR